MTALVAPAALAFRDPPPSVDDPSENIAAEGNSDWRGDIDGLNIANRMANDPALSFSQALDDYLAEALDDWIEDERTGQHGNDD